MSDNETIFQVPLVELWNFLRNNSDALEQLGDITPHEVNFETGPPSRPGQAPPTKLCRDSGISFTGFRRNLRFFVYPGLDLKQNPQSYYVAFTKPDKERIEGHGANLNWTPQ